MGLQLYNPRTPSDKVTYLAVPVLEDLKNSVVSIGYAGTSAAAAFMALNTIAAPVAVIVAGTASTAYTTLLSKYERATSQSLKDGNVKIIIAKRPKI